MFGPGHSPRQPNSPGSPAVLPSSVALERWSNDLVEMLEAIVNHFSQPNDVGKLDATVYPPGTPLEADVVASHSDSDKVSGIIIAVIQWLQACCVEGQGQEGAPCAKPWPTNGDVDAAVRSRWRGCDDRSLSSEVQLLECVWKSLRRGALPEAQQVCIDAEQHWRAASLSGGAFWEVMKDETGTQTRSGNPFRLLWKRMQWENSEAFGGDFDSTNASARQLALYERTIAARLGGNPYTLLSSPLISTWWDALWGLLNAVLDARFTREVIEHRRTQLERTKHLPLPAADLNSVDDDATVSDLLGDLEHDNLRLSTMSIADVFAALDKPALLGEWSTKGGASPFGQLQTMIVLTAANRPQYEARLYSTMREVVLKVSPDENRPSGVLLQFPHVCKEADLEAVPVLRFAADYVTAHRSTIPHGLSEMEFDGLCDDVLIVYARHLIATSRIKDTVNYLSCVKSVERVQWECANFMHFIGPAHLRGEFMEAVVAAFHNSHYSLTRDIACMGVNSLLSLSEAQYRVGEGRAVLPSLPVPSSFSGCLPHHDWARVQAVHWLSCLPALHVDAVTAGNALARKLVMEAFHCDSLGAGRKRLALRLLLAGLPEHDLPPVVPTSPEAELPWPVGDEYVGWMSYVSVYESHSLFVNALAASKARLQTLDQRSVAASSAFHRSGLVASKSLRDEAEKLSSDLVQALQDVGSRLQSLLSHGLFVCPPAECLPGILPVFTAPPLDAVRKCCTPLLCDMFHTVLFQMALWYITLPMAGYESAGTSVLADSIAVARVVADPKYGLFSSFSDDQMTDFLTKISAASEQLLHSRGWL